MSKDFNDNNIIHVKDNQIEYIKFKILEKYSDKLKHCITLRHGGVSTGCYESLNFRITGEDTRKNVLKNLNTICNCLKIDSEKIYKSKLGHTDKILVLDLNNKEEYKYTKYNTSLHDAFITKEKNVGTFVTTADCIPVIMYDPKKEVVATIHSGWARNNKTYIYKSN
ncbi:MAG: laccase domain-containing protein [Clostridia bacterium]